MEEAMIMHELIGSPPEVNTDTSKAPERKYSKPSDVYGADLSNVTESPEVIWLTFSEGELSWTDRRTDDEDIPYVRADIHADIHAAMQARAKKAEATIGLKDALIQEERRVRVRAETARDRLRHAVEDLEAERDALRAENERLREALRPFAEYMQTDEGRLDRDNHGNDLPDNDGVGWVYLTHGDFRAARAALERKEVGQCAAGQ